MLTRDPKGTMMSRLFGERAAEVRLALLLHKPSGEAAAPADQLIDQMSLATQRAALERFERSYGEQHDAR